MSVLKLAPSFAQKSEVLYKLAVIFGKTYQLDYAVNYFKLATLESSGAPAMNRRIDILIKMAICYIEKKEYVDALRSAEAALAMNDQNYRALQHVAWCEFLLEKYTQALEHINKAIALKESDADGYYISGRILMATEKYPAAGDSFKKAILHNHSKVTYLGSSGILNALTKSYKEAFDEFLRATQIDKSVPEIWFNIGILYEIHQQYPEALVAYDKVLEADPTFNGALLRKQALSTDNPIKSSPPQFMHPEFRVFDPMVPMKSYLNNQKVRKAIEPCLNPEFAVQPSSIMKTIFNNIEQAPIELPANNVREEAKNSEKLPSPPVEEAKEEVKQEAAEEKKETVPNPKPEPAPQPAPEKEPPRLEQSIPKIPIPEPNYTDHAYYIPSMTHPVENPMPQPKPVRPPEMPGSQYTGGLQMPSQPYPSFQPPSSMPNTMPGNNYPPLSGASLQQMDLLAQLSQFQFQNFLGSCGILPQTINAYLQFMQSCMQPSMPSGKIQYGQPPFGGNMLMNMGRPMPPMMGGGEMQPSYGQYQPPMPRGPMVPSMPMYNSAPQMQNPSANPSYMMPHMSYGAPEQPVQYALRPEAPPQKLPETIPIPVRPALQHPRPVRPAPRAPIAGKSAGRLEDLIKVASGESKARAGDEEKKGNDPNMVVKLNVSPNRGEESQLAKRKRPETDVGKETAAERERHGTQTRRSKTSNCAGIVINKLLFLSFTMLYPNNTALVTPP
eukprot:TRINITY_DN8164_c0_g1_i2.p1 TRINITY_DN8164_c0_g1~~TRINITY_DN8164_c0_g1_i2.p1  ORF type:complete len:726 (-),score=179.32 TRINITY_DN8164_c0_g1_i2:104-2281(-)